MFKNTHNFLSCVILDVERLGIKRKTIVAGELENDSRMNPASTALERDVHTRFVRRKCQAGGLGLVRRRSVQDRVKLALATRPRVDPYRCAATRVAVLAEIQKGPVASKE